MTSSLIDFWYLYDYFPGVRDLDCARYLPAAEIKQLITEAGFGRVVVEPAEHIQRTFAGEAVFEDPFLSRESTSQLLLISEAVYLEGKRAVASAIENARRQGRSVHSRTHVTLFATIGEANASPTVAPRNPASL